MTIEGDRLGGRVAVITGAGQGLGRAIAEVLADAGAAVAVLGRTESKVAAVLAEFGGVDILINNAQGGNMTVRVPTDEVSDADVLECFSTRGAGEITYDAGLFRGATRQWAWIRGQLRLGHWCARSARDGRIRHGQRSDRRADESDCHLDRTPTKEASLPSHSSAIGVVGRG